MTINSTKSVKMAPGMGNKAGQSALDGLPGSDHLSDILTSIPAAVLVLNTHGKITDANPASEAMFNTQSASLPLVGRYWRDLIDEQFVHQADDGHEVSTLNGRRVNISTCPLKSGDGQVVLIKDITETRQLQGQIARDERLAALGEMAATLAHQLRTPLSTATLYASQLGTAGLDDESRTRFSNTLAERLTHMESMVQDMLSFVRGGDARPAETLPVTQLVESVLADMHSRLQGESIHFKYFGNTETIDLLCDRTAMHNALLALLDNAVDACCTRPAGERRISLQWRKINPLTLKISVSDNGDGMSEVTEKHVFEPFYTTRSDGTGLGLPLVFGVARAHGGKVEIDSKASRGTTVSLLLPLPASTRRATSFKPAKVLSAHIPSARSKSASSSLMTGRDRATRYGATPPLNPSRPKHYSHAS